MKKLIFSLMLAMAPLTASAEDTSKDLFPLTFQLDWKAQAEQGGYWMAKAKGYYRDCGLDLTLRPGGPSMDTTQLLVTGAVDATLVYVNDAVMHMNAAGFPARAVMAAYQKFPMILLYHEESGIKGPEDMAGHPIMIAQGGRSTFWPWLKAKYHLKDSQIRTYSGQSSVWLQNKDALQQAFISNEPNRIHDQAGFWPKYIFPADLGYDAYASLVTVSQKLIDAHPQAVQCLVDGSRRGWADFIKDPQPAFDAIRASDPENTQAVMEYAYHALLDGGVLENDDTAANGVGTMTDARWQAHDRMMVDLGVVDPEFDVKSSYTLQFLKGEPS